MNHTVHERIRATFADAGCVGWLHARRIDPDADSTHEISMAADDHVVMTSVYKLVLAVAVLRAFADGRLDPAERVEAHPTTLTPGPTGLSLLTDPVALSRRDLVVSMLTASDNAAADLLLGQVGLDAVQTVSADLGLSRTRIVGGTADVHEALRVDMAVHTTREAFDALASPEVDVDVSVYDPALTSATTARDMTTLLAAVWSGEAVTPGWSEFLKTTMARQIWTNRIRSGFPHRGVTVAGKTGTIGIIRNEVAVVHHTGEVPVAVAVFTRAARSEPHLPVVDTAIGTAARIAVTALRSGPVAEFAHQL
ncbi:serine hydrolase [Rhodococcus sp. HNM0569]|uniref:serine hydrolase n=1 Tax=Rhodococcus sp. HNM0569 TaxID=2716340 RepID=UPI00146DAE2A|nr:serine hydrolase [Rhodococcus sp. HNM0569]NLU83402.1 serine hydrolase [Rhodococcus sp. HNM0569]